MPRTMYTTYDLAVPAQAEYTVGELVEHRHAGQEWFRGYVTSVNPLLVNYEHDNDPTGWRFDEVRKYYPEAS